MDIVNDLLGHHVQLRRSLMELESLLGPGTDAGWDDCSTCDMAGFQAGLRDFQGKLREHETYYDKGFMVEALEPLPGGHAELRKGFQKSHETVDNLTKLLAAAAAVDHGRHVYSVRHIVVRVREELEALLAYEERGIFPALRSEKAGRQRR